MIASRRLWANFVISRDCPQEGFERTESTMRLRCNLRGDNRSPEGSIPAVFLRNWQIIRVHGRGNGVNTYLLTLLLVRLPVLSD